MRVKLLSMAVTGRVIDIRTVRVGRSAQLAERRSAKRGVAGLKPGRTNIQGLLLNEKKVLHLSRHL